VRENVFADVGVCVFVSYTTSCAALPARLLCVCECGKECVCRCGFVRVYVVVVHDFLCGSAGKIAMSFCVFDRDGVCVSLNFCAALPVRLLCVRVFEREIERECLCDCACVCTGVCVSCVYDIYTCTCIAHAHTCVYTYMSI